MAGSWKNRERGSTDVGAVASGPLERLGVDVRAEGDDAGAPGAAARTAATASA